MYRLHTSVSLANVLCYWLVVLYELSLPNYLVFANNFIFWKSKYAFKEKTPGPARILWDEFSVLLRIIHPRGSKKWNKKHGDGAKFCCRGFLSLALCFDLTGVVFTLHSADFGGEAQSEVIQSNTEVTEPRLPCWQGSGSHTSSHSITS